MKYLLIVLLLINWMIPVNAQVSESFEIDFTYEKAKTKIVNRNQGGLLVNVSPEDLKKFNTEGTIRYSDFGASGDGKTDDIYAIAATHAFANQHGLSVKADEEATYFIGGNAITAIIQTDTDFGSARFIIDDKEVEDRDAPVFLVKSEKESFIPEQISSLKRGQEKIALSLPGTSLITVSDSLKMHYIRYGLNQNSGSPKTGIFVVDKEGNVDMEAPIIWDFDKITSIELLPVDETKLTISGGEFITIANQAESEYNYYSRNISIRRSNVLVDGLKHFIQGEGDQGAPYRGFINIGKCAYVTIQNCTFTGHKTYVTIGRAGKAVSMGSYDISVNRALNVSFINCKQTNDINDSEYWGIMGSNYCKNLLYDQCTLSRFDAHKGVANATIRNSEPGHMGINAIGSGLLTVENTTVRGWSFINLRSDYGSTWQGEFTIRDCIFVPGNGRETSASIINGNYSGKHDFGYTCYMPEKILFENFHIDDSNHSENYKGPAIFADFNPENTSKEYTEQYKYVITQEVILNNVTTSSGKDIRLSDNPWMFREVELRKQ